MTSSLKIKKLTIGGILLAIGIIIPRIFHMFGDQALGTIFLPMHLGVFIAGIFLGGRYGLLIGFLTPLLNSLMGAPIFPFNVFMAFELAAYGFFSGMMMKLFKNVLKKHLLIYLSLLVSMILGRAVYAAVLYVGVEVIGLQGKLFSSASVIKGLPGIAIQFILVPIVVLALDKFNQGYEA